MILRRPERTHKGIIGSRFCTASAVIAAVLATFGLGPVGIQADDSVPNVAVTDQQMISYNHSSLARSPLHPQRLATAFVDATQRKFCGIGLSEDGGKTWTTERLFGTADSGAIFAGPPPGVTGTVRACQDQFSFPRSYPRVAFGPDGSLFYLFQLDLGSRRRVFLASSPGSGSVSFEQPRLVNPNSNSGSEMEPAISVNPNTGQVYVAWSRYENQAQGGTENNAILATTFDGTGFSTPVEVSPIEHASPQSSQITVGNDGAVYVVWVDQSAWMSSAGTIPADIQIASSQDHGRSFSAPSRVAGIGERHNCSLRCEELNYNIFVDALNVVAGKTPGDVYVAWFDAASPEDRRTRVHFNSSSDFGKTWDSAKTVAAPHGHESSQHRPWLSVAPNGRLDIGYYSIAPPDDSGVRAQDVFAASSCDGGGTFLAPHKITDVSSDARIGTAVRDNDSIRALGRPGILSSDTTLFAAWTDSRRGTLENAKQDVYFAETHLVPDCLPNITSLLPNSGFVTGGEKVVIKGSFLGGATLVEFGSESLQCPGPTCKIVNGSEIEVVTPPHPAGEVSVTVTTGFGRSNALPFLYMLLPGVIQASPEPTLNVIEGPAPENIVPDKMRASPPDNSTSPPSASGGAPPTGIPPLGAPAGQGAPAPTSAPGPVAGPSASGGVNPGHTGGFVSSPSTGSLSVQHASGSTPVLVDIVQEEVRPAPRHSMSGPNIPGTLAAVFMLCFLTKCAVRGRNASGPTCRSPQCRMDCQAEVAIAAAV